MEASEVKSSHNWVALTMNGVSALIYYNADHTVLVGVSPMKLKYDYNSNTE